MRDRELILKRIKAFISSSLYNLVNVSGRPPPLLDQGNNKLIIIKLVYSLNLRVLKLAN
jgi:hypothetical protein